MGKRFSRIAILAAASVGLWTAPAITPAAHATDLSQGGNLCDEFPTGYNLTGASGASLIVGTPGPDILNGTSADDTILGCGGNDTLVGNSGDDLLIGGQGSDLEQGLAGNDTFQMGEFTTYDSHAQLPVADGGRAAYYKFTVQNAGTIRDVNVRLDVSDPNPQDLVMTLFACDQQGAPGCDPGTGAAKVLLTTQNCGGTCGPGSFDNPTSPETGVSFDSEAIVDISKSGSTGKNLNGRFHPLGSLDTTLRGKPVCAAGVASCTWEIKIQDAVKNSIPTTNTAFYGGIDFEFAQGPDGSGDTLQGGTGNSDTILYTSRFGDITYTGEDNLANDGEAGEADNAGSDIEWIYTGSGNDVVTGTENSKTNSETGGFNDIRTMAGNDQIYGLGGDDRFRGGVGDDFEDGGAGTDKLDGNDGTDTCQYGETYLNCEIIR